MQKSLSKCHSEVTLHPPSAEKTLRWITVLSARNLDYRLSQENGIWQLHVPVEQAAVARHEIEAFEYEEQQSGRPIPQQEQHSRQTIRTAYWTAFWSTYILLLVYLGLGSFDPDSRLHVAGAMSRTELFAGQWWRTITAQTLHSGLAHIAANSFFLFFVGQAVIRELGRGLGPLLILSGGILGNLLAALTASPYQRSVGASTACFAALGIISTLQAANIYRRFHSWNHVWRQTWIPLAAGMALLGITGTSPGSDIAAHLFGFLAGATLAILPARFPHTIQQLSRSMQWTLTGLCGGLIALAWTLAAITP